MIDLVEDEERSVRPFLGHATRNIPLPLPTPVRASAQLTIQELRAARLAVLGVPCSGSGGTVGRIVLANDEAEGGDVGRSLCGLRLPEGIEVCAYCRAVPPSSKIGCSPCGHSILCLSCFFSDTVRSHIFASSCPVCRAGVAVLGFLPPS